MVEDVTTSFVGSPPNKAQNVSITANVGSDHQSIDNSGDHHPQVIQHTPEKSFLEISLSRFTTLKRKLEAEEGKEVVKKNAKNN